jgi:Ca-activated chloride channel family protein
LLEYAGKDLFQASIFPIPARSDKKLEITYTQVLKAESNVVSYRYPLGTGKNLNVIEQVAGRVEIEGKDVIRNIYSPSHAIDNNTSHASNRAVVTFETNRKQEPQDFQLFYSISKDDFGLSLLTYREAGKDGYFLLLLSPKDNISEQELVAKDVVFVIDTSGSMADEGKIDKAKAALVFGVKNLRDEDRFNIISFAGEEHLMESGLIRADAAGRKKGDDFVKSLRPTGGTNINDSLIAAFKQFDSSDRPKLLVFMTDGLPTVSETKIPRIMDNVKKASKEGIRLFTFGVGYDVNTELLDKLAADNSGVSDYVEPKEDLEIRVSNFFAKVNYPVLTDIALDMGEVQTDFMYPRKLTDMFKGTQIAMIGRYRNNADLQRVTFRLTGRNGKESRSFRYENLSFPLRENKNDFLPRLWATRRVGWLMEQIRTNSETKELRDEVVDLGTRYGIVTPYTSYLALESGERDGRTTNVTSRNTSTLPSGDFGGLVGRRNERQAGGAPNTVADMSTSAPSKADDANKKTGNIAVNESKRQRAQQEAVVTSNEASINYSRNVRSRNFYSINNVWTDSEFRSEAKLPETTVEFGSDAYFELIKKEPELAEYFALGEEVVVVHKGRVYRVVAAKKQ